MKFSARPILLLSPLVAALVMLEATFQRSAEASAPISTSLGIRLKDGSTEAFFEQARQELTSEDGVDDYYVLYRIVERIARANGLDERPWRVRLSQEYEVNAYASELNTLTFMAGLLDQVHGDNAAIACVVGHEMAHHTQDHIPLRVEVGTRLEQLLAEAEAEAVAEIQAARQQQATNSAIGGIIGRVVGGAIGGYEGAVVGGTTQDVLADMSDSQRQEAEARASEIYQEKVAALNAEYSVILQSQEYESDEYGFKYIVRAGFDPQGCLRVMGVLDQLQHSRLPSFSHPNPADRIQRLNELNTPNNVNTLVSEGQTYLARSPQPLKYSPSRDGISLRIESRYGTSGSGFPE